MASSATREALERLIGDRLTRELYNAARDVDRLEQVAAQVMTYYKKDSTFPLVENLVITCVKFAFVGGNSRNIELYDKIDNFVNTASMEESTREFVRRTIFMNGYLESPGIKIFRSIH